VAEALLVLASASPRRAAILRALGVPFRVRPSAIEEKALPGEEPARTAERLAREKALEVAAFESLPVVAADTIVVCQGRLLGKPASEAEAREMLRLLQGRDHEVLTGVCVAVSGALRSGVDRTQVRFAAMTEGEIDAYVATQEPMDKAGAYHVDGFGALFLSRVDGSPSNVAGLPVRLLRELLRSACLDVGLP
jgi:septum formation protein